MRVSEILLVEDDFILNFELREILEGIGYRIVSVYCSNAAIEALNRHQYLAALLTDIDLGPGPDGFEIARRARAAYPDLPVVFTSGAMAAGRFACGVPGSEFIPKPFQPRQVVEALARVIHL